MNDGDAHAQDRTGRVIGNWRIERLLGQGAFGAVYEAQNVTITGRRAAMKILHPHMAVHAEIRRRFVNEASAASQADHQNIVRVYDGGETSAGECYVVMELLRGRTLGALLAEVQRLDLGRAVAIGERVAAALSAAHAIGVVHRDLKPENIFLSTVGGGGGETVKVLDFGVAKVNDDPSGLRTGTGVWLGTPAYMSPDQWQTLPDLDGRSDVYALGVVLYECLAGRLPFEAPNTYGWMTAHLTQPVPALESLGVHPSAARLVERMLAKRREDRPATMEQVRRELALFGATSAAPSAEPQASVGPSIVDGFGGLDGRPAREMLAVAARSSTMGGAVGEVAGGTIQGSRAQRWKVGLAALAVLGIAAVALWSGQGRVATSSTPATSQPETPPTPPPAPPPAPRLGTAPEGMVAIPVAQQRASSVGREVEGAPTRPYAMGRAEITIAEYKAFVDQGKAVATWPPLKDLSVLADKPVLGVGDGDAERYCRWRYGASGRLPSEAEWQWAARGAEGRRFPWGNEFRPECVNALDRSGAVEPSDAHLCGATPEGVRDLAGNVAEWTSTVVASGERVVRGGAYNTRDPEQLTTTSRQLATGPSRTIGFRCVADLVQP